MELSIILLWLTILLSIIASFTIATDLDIYHKLPVSYFLISDSPQPDNHKNKMRWTTNQNSHGTYCINNKPEQDFSGISLFWTRKPNITILSQENWNSRTKTMVNQKFILQEWKQT